MEIQALESERSKIRITPDGRISRQHAADYLGLAYVTLMQWERAGRFGLKSIKIGRRVFYPFKTITAIANGQVDDDGNIVSPVGNRA